MQVALEQVREFHQRIGAQVSDRPTLLSGDQGQAAMLASALRQVLTQCHAMAPAPDSLTSRLGLAIEELAEWVEAHASGDLTAAADAWGDRLYVLLGDAVATGLPGQTIFNEVHRSNMTKSKAELGPTGKALKKDEFLRPILHTFLPTD
jgi:predicted HAD superfamily Cof-like phosphohydrolase